MTVPDEWVLFRVLETPHPPPPLLDAQLEHKYNIQIQLKAALTMVTAVTVPVAVVVQVPLPHSPISLPCARDGKQSRGEGKEYNG